MQQGYSAAEVVEQLAAVPEAVVETFRALCGTDLERMPDDFDAGEVGAEGLVLAVVSLVGDVEWSLILAMPRQVATGLASEFAGFEIPFDSSDMGDAIGELANVVGGTTKALLDRRSVSAELSLPSVIRAQRMEVLLQKNQSSAHRFWFRSPHGLLGVSVLAGGTAALGI